MSVAANRVNGVLHYGIIEMEQNYLSLKFSLRRVGLFAASPVKTYLSRIMNLSRSKNAVRVAPQNYPGASGQMAMNTHCSLTARRFN
jgi:predicted component of type VI protein secretion system